MSLCNFVVGGPSCDSHFVVHSASCGNHFVAEHSALGHNHKDDSQLKRLGTLNLSYWCLSEAWNTLSTEPLQPTWHLLLYKIYTHLCWDSSKTGLSITPTCSTCGPLDISIVQHDKGYVAISGQDSLEGIDLQKKSDCSVFRNTKEPTIKEQMYHRIES